MSSCSVRMASGVRCSAPDFLRDCRFSRRPGKTYNSAVSLRAVSRSVFCGNSGCQALGRRHSLGTGFRRDICNTHIVPLVYSLPRVVRRAAYESCFHAAHPSGRCDRLAHRQKAKQRRQKPEKDAPLVIDTALILCYNQAVYRMRR